MLIKNTQAHLDTLHDGRPLPAFAVAEITSEESELAFYQARFADGLLIECPEGTHVGPEIPATPEPDSKPAATRPKRAKEKV